MAKPSDNGEPTCREWTEVVGGVKWTVQMHWDFPTKEQLETIADIMPRSEPGLSELLP